MKAARIVQLLLVVLAAVYLWLFHNANPEYVELPWLSRFFLGRQPVGFVVVVAVLVGWLIGWVPGRIVLWRRTRQLRRAENELAEERLRTVPHEPEAAGYYTDHGVPVIPDRPYLEDPVIPDRAYDADPDDPDEAA